jgi:carbamoyltransferase
MVPSENIVIGGGCALNSSYNGKILEHTPFNHLYVPSAPADDGNAIGAALLAYNDSVSTSPQSKHKSFQTPYLGSSISRDRLDHFIQHGNVEHLRYLPKTICQETAKLLAQGKLVAWVQGRAEFGPRALGNRSLLAAPYPAGMKDKINAVVKFREGFRPFAPSILHEFGHHYFEHYQESPYMERTLTFRDEVIDKIPAVVHVNQTGRLQTVKKEWNPRFYTLIKSFYDLVKIPLLLNTSFNVMGKPIVHSIEDAVGMFYTTGIDVLVIGDYLIEKGSR